MSWEATARWRPWLDLLQQAVPSAAEVLARDVGRAFAEKFGDPWDEADMPGQIQTSLCMEALVDDVPAPGTERFWPEFLAFTELTAEAYEWLAKRDVDSGLELDGDQDLLELSSFVQAGVICDITQSREGFRQLLPFLGPNLVAVAHAEVGAHHRVQHAWGGRDIDWTIGGSKFVRLDQDPWVVLPLDRRGLAQT